MIFSDVINQGAVFAAGFFCGAVSGIFYDIIYVIRILSGAGKIPTIALDFVFCLLSVSVFLFVIYRANGLDIKWYIIAAAMLGFTFERFSFKKPVAHFAGKVYNILVIIKNKLHNIFKKKKEEGV